MYEKETYEEILARTLKRMPKTMDRRESSFLYNAAAPVSVEHQNMYIALDTILDMTFFDTADRESKLKRCRERGIDISVFEAAPAVCVMNTKPEEVEIRIGERFNYETINFTVIEQTAPGVCNVVCETNGSAGNVTGIVTPINYIPGLHSAEIVSILTYGEDEADGTAIDSAYYASLSAKAFGGNRADYVNKVKQIPGIGGVKLYSAKEWLGGGTVRMVIMSSSYTKPTDEFVEIIQTEIDPMVNQGAGYGIAPIGHTVTVAGAGETRVNIGMVLVLQEGYRQEDVKPQIEAIIDEYFEELNKKWEDSENIVVRISQIETRILDIPIVVDIYGTTLNEFEKNLTIDRDSLVVRGEIIATG